MTDLMRTVGRTVRSPADRSPGSALVPSAEGTTLVTEQQVLFGTAAAVAPRPVMVNRWAAAMKSVSGAVSALFTDSRPPAQRHVPKRYAFLENALMGREMDRL